MSNIPSDNVVRLKDVRAGEIVDQVARTVSSMADQLSDNVRRLRSKASVAVRSTDSFVKASPWQAVGAVALAGLATGLLISYVVRGRQPDPAAELADNYDENSGG